MVVVAIFVVILVVFALFCLTQFKHKMWMRYGTDLVLFCVVQSLRLTSRDGPVIDRYILYRKSALKRASLVAGTSKIVHGDSMYPKTAMHCHIFSARIRLAVLASGVQWLTGFISLSTQTR